MSIVIAWCVGMGEKCQVEAKRNVAYFFLIMYGSGSCLYPFDGRS